MGHIRRKASGHYEVRFRDPRGREHGRTFRTRAEAKRYLGQVEHELASLSWRDPALGRVRFEEYATWWLDNRPELRPRSRELYAALLKNHLIPTLGSCRFEDLTTPTVRAWHAELLKKGRPGPSTVAKCYRLLRTILNDAVEDDLLVRNPCTIRGAGVERPAERPIATIAQVYALAEAIEPRYRAMVFIATFCGLRLGELLALRRTSVDLVRGRVDVREQLVELSDGSRHIGPPKTTSGMRTVTIPPHVLEDLKFHLDKWVQPEDDALVFSSPEGGFVRRSNFRRRVWQPAADQVGLARLHFHDLRHTGNTLAASTGASTKELMTRMGHASSRAALIYQHATEERDVAIAQAISGLVEQSRKSAGPTDEDSGGPPSR